MDEVEGSQKGAEHNSEILHSPRHSCREFVQKDTQELLINFA